MKKLIIALFVAGSFVSCQNSMMVSAEEQMVTIQIPASSIESIDVNYENQNPSSTSKAIDATKNAANTTVEKTKLFAKKTADTTKTAADKTVTATKNAANTTVTKSKLFAKKTADTTKTATDKTVTATKSATTKAVDATKSAANKTVEGTKDIIDNLNPNKSVTLEELETSASVKTLKNERDEIKAAYNSKIKDVNAQIKAAESSTTISDVQRRNKIYTLNKEKTALTEERDKVVLEYNNKIKALKNSK